MSLAIKSAILLSLAGTLCMMAGAGFLFTGDPVLGGSFLTIGLTLVVISAVIRNTTTVDPEQLPDAQPPDTDG